MLVAGHIGDVVVEVGPDCKNLGNDLDPDRCQMDGVDLPSVLGDASVLDHGSGFWVLH